jgi:hypothetical protein
MEDRNMKSGFILGLGLLGAAALGVAASSPQANAAPVGETHRVTTERTASLRDAQHRPELRIAIWYPAASDAVESSVVIGPANRVPFEVGAAAADAAFAEDGAPASGDPAVPRFWRQRPDDGLVWIAPPRTYGLAAGSAIPNARLDLLAGVSHYDFLSMCTDAGRAISPACASAHAQADTHRRAIAAAETFFGRYLSGSQ